MDVNPDDISIIYIISLSIFLINCHSCHNHRYICANLFFIVLHKIIIFPDINNFCHLLFSAAYVLTVRFLGSLYCKQHGPRSDCSLRSFVLSLLTFLFICTRRCCIDKFRIFHAIQTSIICISTSEIRVRLVPSNMFK